MKVYAGKWYIAMRFRNDLCLGVGRAPEWMRDQAVRSRPHWNV